MKDPRGGARVGSGRKPIKLNIWQVARMMENANVYEEKFGKSVDMVLLDILYDQDATHRDRLAAVKIFYELISRVAQDEEEEQHIGPSIYLPEKRPDPAKVLQFEAR